MAAILVVRDDEKERLIHFLVSLRLQQGMGYVAFLFGATAAALFGATAAASFEKTAHDVGVP